MSSLFNTQENAPSADVERYQLEEKRKSGAHWFYWIAALSLITSIVSLAGGTWGFFVSLGVTRVVDEIVVGLVDEGGVNSSIKAVAIVLDLVVAGGFALLGYLGARGHVWAFVVGMVLYALDALIFAAVGLWLPLAFHVFALYCIFTGLRAASQLKTLETQQQQTGYAAPAT